VKTAKRWTKTDIRRMCGELDGAWLRCRPPPSYVLGDMQAAAERFRSWLSGNRERVILEGLKGLANMSAAREVQQQRTASHWLEHFDNQEVHDRFVKFAAAEKRTQQRLCKLIARIETVGLPPEVVAYDPTASGASL